MVNSCAGDSRGASKSKGISTKQPGDPELEVDKDGDGEGSPKVLNKHSVFTDYMASRYYRAPEILTLTPYYGF